MIFRAYRMVYVTYVRLLSLHLQSWSLKSYRQAVREGGWMGSRESKNKLEPTRSSHNP